MIEQDLTEDERELLRLVNGFDDGLWGTRRTAHWFRILAHYRKAKAEASDCPRCGEVGCMVSIHPDCDGVEKSHISKEKE